MKKAFLLAVLMIFVTGGLLAEDVWMVKKMGEMTNADFYLLEAGSPKTGLLLGKKNNGGNDELQCFFMTDGELWNACPSYLTNFSMSGGAFLLGAKYSSPDSLYAIRTEIKGMTSSTALIKIDSFLTNMLVIKMFDQNDTMNGTTEVLGNTIWLGTKNGKILKSTDGGQNFTPYTVTTDEKVEIYYIRFSDQNKGYAAGGATEEVDDPQSPGQKTTGLLPKGGVWKTNDGGETWTALVENLEYGFIKIFPIGGVGFGDISTGRWYAMYTNQESYGAGGDVTKHIGVTDNNFATLTETDPVANTGRKFNGYQAYGMDLIGDKEVWLGGFCSDFKACSMVSKDGGGSWTEMFLPTAVAEGTNFMWSFRAQYFLDSRHGYAAGSLNTIFKFGDPNEDYTEIPDDSADEDTESADDDVVDADSKKAEADSVATNDTQSAADDDVIEEDIAPACGCSVVY